MTTKQDSVLKEYAAVNEQIAALEEKQKELKPKVLSLLEKEGIDTMKETYGTFSVVYRKTWTYTESLVSKEKQYAEIIKAAKTEEQGSGEAKNVDNKTLSYRAYVPNEKE